MWGVRRLRAAFAREVDVPQDGFGQSLLDDLRFLHRFRRCRTAPVAWRRPSRGEDAQYESHAVLGRFGDFTEAIATVDRRTWVVRERIFNGWPDPPRFAFFALEPDGAIWAAADFHQWPPGWSIDGAATAPDT
ncbi:MAG: hypothetical protein J0H65_17390 [Rhizobiales bacterium]|nr:hypothetical protein [Hyphomicrobiales bacterium]